MTKRVIPKMKRVITRPPEEYRKKGKGMYGRVAPYPRSVQARQRAEQPVPVLGVPEKLTGPLVDPITGRVVGEGEKREQQETQGQVPPIQKGNVLPPLTPPESPLVRELKRRLAERGAVVSPVPDRQTPPASGGGALPGAVEGAVAPRVPVIRSSGREETEQERFDRVFNDPSAWSDLREESILPR